MKYFTIEITVINGQTAQAIFERADFKTALSAHHSVMASALANTNCTEVLSMVIGSDGTQYANEHWKAEEIEEPEE